MFSLALALTLLVPALPASAEEPASTGQPLAKVARTQGDVTLLLHGSAAPVEAAAGAALSPGDTVRTGPDSEADILLGGESVVNVRANSSFQIADPDKKEPLRLDLGTILLKIQKKRWLNLKVLAPNAVAAVRGTEFAVQVEPTDEAGKAGRTVVAVFDEGEVSVGNDAGSVTLEPKQETICAEHEAPTRPGPLRILLKYRANMRLLRGRLETLKRAYREKPLEKRRELEEKLREKSRQP